MCNISAVPRVPRGAGPIGLALSAYDVWRRLHYLNFAVWTLALIHGIAAGTDSDTAWGAAVYAACGGSVLGAVAWRTLRPRVTAWAARLSLATGTVVGAELVLAVMLGPFAHHG